MDQLLEELNIHPSQSELELTIRYRDIEVLNGVRLSPSEVIYAGAQGHNVKTCASMFFCPSQPATPIPIPCPT
eukprot:1153031-Pelagomonas_calceolata.AAC.2